MGYDTVRRPHLDGSIYAPALGLHLHVGVRAGRLARVGISASPHTGAASPKALPLLERLEAHCRTGRDDFRDVPLDLEGLPDLHREALTTLVREVPPGSVVTYSQLAALIGRGPGAARAVGAAMAANPIPIVVPCHRVIPAGGRVGSRDRSRGEDVRPAKWGAAGSAHVGNYSGEGGWETKLKLLRIERAPGVWAQRTLI